MLFRSVQCAKCGEALMGSVNRCWRCGQEFVARRTEAGLPPIRRAPVGNASQEVFVAQLSEIPSVTTEASTSKRPDGKSRPATVRRGSPFRDRGRAVLEAIDPDQPQRESQEMRDREVGYQKKGGAAASAALCLPLAVISFVAAFLLPLAGISLALLGVGFSVWGLSSRRRGLAMAGLALCCLSLTTGIFNGSVAFYVSRYGVAPWETGTFQP